MSRACAAYTHMKFSMKNQRVITTKKYYEGNARISSRIPSEERSPYYFLITMGGGYTEGEDYQVKIDVDDEASALITSQAPTYVYRSLNGEITTQEITLSLGKNSVLEFMMDDLLPYADARYLQTTRINMEDSSTLFYLDGVTSGWSKNQSTFQYNDLHLDTKIYQNNQLVLNDHFISIPKDFETMNHLGLFEEYKNYNSLIVINPNITTEYIEKIRTILDKLEVHATYGISELEVPGFILRVLGERSEDNRQIIMECANQARIDLLGYPKYQFRKSLYVNGTTN